MARVVREIMFAVKVCRRDLGISERRLSNLKAIAENSTFSNLSKQLMQTESQQQKACNRQMVCPSTLEEYWKGFNLALSYMRGVPEISEQARRACRNGKIASKYLILECLFSLGIENFSQLHSFWQNESWRSRKTRGRASKPALRFVRYVIAGQVAT